MDVPGAYDGTTGTNVGKMLEQSGLPEARLAELYKMISEFIEPRNGLWNYTGD